MANIKWRIQLHSCILKSSEAINYEFMNEWMTEWMNEWMNDAFIWINELINEWIN